MLIAVDPTAAVVDEAIDAGADLLLVHHPLLLRGVDTVGAHTPKGALVHKLIRAGCALFTAHTNADSADPGVSDALAAALGLHRHRPDRPARPPRTWTSGWSWCPADDADTVRRALFDAGAGHIGDYRDCSWSVTGHRASSSRPTARTRPSARSARSNGVEESRVEVVAPRGIAAEVLAALRAAHPYEEVAFDVFELATFPGPRGLGRVGELARAAVAARIHRPGGGRAARHDVGRAGRGRPRSARSAPSRCAAAPATRTSDAVVPTRRGRLRHRRSATPPGGRAPARRRSGPDRRRALGERAAVV